MKTVPTPLAHVARVLSDAKVNILTFCVGTGSRGDVHLIVNNSNKAKKALSALGVTYKEADAVLNQKLPNVAGALGHFAGKSAGKEINVTSRWGTTLKGSKTAAIVLGVSDLNNSGLGSLVG